MVHDQGGQGRSMRERGNSIFWWEGEETKMRRLPKEKEIFEILGTRTPWPLPLSFPLVGKFQMEYSQLYGIYTTINHYVKFFPC